MRIFDTNLIIYSYQPQYESLKLELIKPDICVSLITILETWGYHKITESEKGYFTDLFKSIILIPVENKIIEKAITLRQEKKISVGDSILAASALIHNFTLFTRNIKDFNWIPELRIVDPLA